MLKGIKVIELASVLAGPSAGMFLAELGAEVIKVENPSTHGDVTRTWRHPAESLGTDIPAYFSSFNWGKRSIVINLHTEKGKALLHEMIRKADIVITSYKKGDDKKFSVDHQTLSALNPNVIYASVTGYGEHDERVAYDAVLQAESGFMSMNGTSEGPPLKMPVALVDVLASHQLKEAILLALLKRERTGQGSKLSVSLLDSALVSLANQASNYLMTGKAPERIGSLHPNIAPYGETFQTSDGRYIILAIGNDKQFRNLCSILELPDITTDPRFESNHKRVLYRRELASILSLKFADRTSEELKQALDRLKIPAGIVNNVAEALDQASHLILKDEKAQSMRQSAFVTDTSMLPPPHYGEHSREILSDWLSLNESEIALLFENKIIS